MKKMRIGIIGLGGVAKAHLQAFDHVENVTLAAVCDVQAEVSFAIADCYRAKAYTDYNQMLTESDLDLAMVLTPASTHRQIVEAVAQAGVAVFCEKPIAVTLDDAEAMVACCQSAGVKLFYGSCYRYLPAIIKAQELILSGTIGKIQLMTEQLIGGNGYESYRQLAPIHYPNGGPGGPGMGLVDHGVHLIDIFSWLSGEDIIDAHGVGQISGAPAASEVMTMRFDSGAIGQLTYNAATYSTTLPNEGMFSGGQGWLADSSIALPGLWENEPGSISIYGTTGSLRIFHYTNALFMKNHEGLRRIDVSGRPAFGHFATQLESCVKAITHNRQPDVSGEDGVTALKALLKVYSNTERGDN